MKTHMNMIDQIETPIHVLLTAGGAIISSIVWVGTYSMSLANLALPTPDQADAVTLKAAMMITVVFLVSCILWLLRFYFTSHLKTTQENRDSAHQNAQTVSIAMQGVKQSIERQIEVTEKLIWWFEDEGKKKLLEHHTMTLSAPKEPPTRRRNSP